MCNYGNPRVLQAQPVGNLTISNDIDMSDPGMSERAKRNFSTYIECNNCNARVVQV